MKGIGPMDDNQPLVENEKTTDFLLCLVDHNGPPPGDGGRSCHYLCPSQEAADYERRFWENRYTDWSGVVFPHHSGEGNCPRCGKTLGTWFDTVE
jgi:hypothetical protein